MKNLIPILALLLLAASCQSFSKYPISTANAETYDARLIGTWKLEEDTNKANYYVVQKGYKTEGHKYHVTFYNRGGKNKTYESTVYFSKVGSDLFLNLPYWFRNADKYPDEYRDYKDNHGYFFLRVLHADNSYSKLTVAVVQDDELANLKSSKDVYARIKQHLNNAAYYHDTVHLYKVQ